jgi:hypothetical protein
MKGSCVWTVLWASMCVYTCVHMSGKGLSRRKRVTKDLLSGILCFLFEDLCLYCTVVANIIASVPCAK